MIESNQRSNIVSLVLVYQFSLSFSFTVKVKCWLMKSTHDYIFKAKEVYIQDIKGSKLHFIVAALVQILPIWLFNCVNIARVRTGLKST